MAGPSPTFAKKDDCAWYSLGYRTFLTVRKDRARHLLYTTLLPIALPEVDHEPRMVISPVAIVRTQCEEEPACTLLQGKLYTK